MVVYDVLKITYNIPASVRNVNVKVKQNKKNEYALAKDKKKYSRNAGENVVNYLYNLYYGILVFFFWPIWFLH